MLLRALRPTGLDYLAVVTRLLQDARLTDPRAGLWEAADLQWRWRVDQHTDENAQYFLLNGDNPIAGAVFTRWGERYGCDLLGSDADLAEHADALWGFVRERLDYWPLEMMLDDADLACIAAAESLGFHASADGDVTAWLSSSSRPRLRMPPDGYRLAAFEGGQHPMVGRNGPAIAERLRECSLYRADLDLAIRDEDADVAAYGLFWSDPVTGVGLVEPMRVESAHQGRGLATALLSAGIDRLAASGCTRLKVSWDPTNEPAARLYTGAGFRPTSSARTFVRDSKSGVVRSAGTAPTTD